MKFVFQLFHWSLQRIRAQRRLICLIVGGSIGTLCVLSPQAQAQSPWDIAISPPTAYVQARLGTKTVHTITLENAGTADLTLQPKVVDFKSNSQTGAPQLSNQTTFPYLTIPSTGLPPVTIPAGQKAQLKLVIEPPIAAPEKEWPLTVLFFQVPETNQNQDMIASVTQDGSTAQISGIIGSNVVVLVSNQSNLPYTLDVESIAVPPVVDSFRDVTFQAFLRNQGLAAVAASGSARVVDFLGNTVYQAPLYPDTVLGHSTRAARALDTNPSPQLSDQPPLLPSPLPPQPAPFTITNRILFGPYRILITLDSPNSDGADQSQAVTFIALPISILLSIGIGCIGFGIFLILRRKQWFFT